MGAVPPSPVDGMLQSLWPTLSDGTHSCSLLGVSPTVRIGIVLC